MRYSKIRKMDISNGPGYRVSLFTQGCLRQCPGCFNKETWDPKGGLPYTIDTRNQIMELCSNPNVVGLSILGGEPLLDVNIQALLHLLTEFKKTFPHKTIWLWTGFTFGNFTYPQQSVVDLCDVVVSGPYVSSLHNLSLKYAGSSNQELWKKDSNGVFVKYPIE